MALIAPAVHKRDLNGVDYLFLRIVQNRLCQLAVPLSQWVPRKALSS